MFTLPFSKHNPIKVTLKNGEVIFARITRVNEATGKVSWIDLKEKWKGSTHVTRAVKATPEELNVIYKERDAVEKAKVANMAPVDPCMAGWELGKTQRGPLMMEGHYYHVSVLFNGKRVGKIVDEGNGGPTMTEHFKDHTLEKQFNKDCETWAKNNGACMSYLEAAAEFWHWWEKERIEGKDAKTYFKEQREQFEEFSKGQTPIHTGNLALVEGKV
jgi:hypothetical protein